MKHRRHALIAGTVLGCSFLCSDVGAQAAVDLVPSGDLLVDFFSGLSVDRDVQITTRNLFIEEADFRHLGSDFVEVERGGATIPVDLDDIRAVSVKSGHPIQGALWGVGAGMLLGAVSGAMVASFGCTTAAACNHTERAGAVRWATVFGAAGGLAGFVIGRYTVYWKPVFP